MINFLFGWVTKPMYMQTPVDGFVILLEMTVLIVLFAIWSSRN